MPRREDIESICILGSGPIVIGQACEFDYSGTQAIRSLKAEGYRVILINSNPATIMTDPELADATYIEPLTPDFVEKVLRKERPDALLPTMGGQTALNLAQVMARRGVLEDIGTELIGASPEVIERAENREQFQQIMDEIGVDQPSAGVARSLDEAWAIQREVGFPAILRPSYTMGGSGGNIAYNRDEFEEYVKWSLSQSPTNEVLIDESLLGWKEFELEVMRDKNDNVVIICGIENLDPLGVHTGDSITVAPIQTLTDREYQDMRDDALDIVRAIGVETGGCNIQFSVDPETGRRVVIEMNPRVSRSSALASKATGYPIAKIAALLAVGYTLDEVQNDITGNTSAAFEPVLDYTVVKMPRFAFEKFPATNEQLTTQMKAVGEVMSIARTFPEALGKAVRSMEIREDGFHPKLVPPEGASHDEIVDFFRPHVMKATPRRLWHVFDALRHGLSVDEIFDICKIDRWFLRQIEEMVDCEALLADAADSLDADLILHAKRLGLGDVDIALFTNLTEDQVREKRLEHGIRPVFKQVDTCAAEFSAVTSYFYSTYERGENEAERSDRESVMILGGGPNRIGQGIEFDYCAVHAALSLRDAGYRTIMVNCNPETVSTDYDISDRLFFEPLTFETVMEIVENEDPVGVILQFGGQTPLKLSRRLAEHGVNILGTDHEVIHRTEDREEFNKIVKKLDLLQPEARTVRTVEAALEAAEALDYPLLVRPSYVLGGLGMEIVYDEDSLRAVFGRAQGESEDSPVLIDRFLNQAVEVDVDCISDGETAVIGGIMEHVEEAGVHSGDSAFVTPPYHLSEAVLRVIREQTIALAHELDIVGLMNVQFAVQNHNVYILEVNPRASRTIPFISKAIGVPLAGYASRAMLGETLGDIGFTEEIIPRVFSAKESVFPFNKFPEVDTLLGPEMKSTGEVMGIDPDFNLAYLKAEIAASNRPPDTGTVFVSVRDEDKWGTVPVAKTLAELGFDIIATRGTRDYLAQHGLEVGLINKVKEGQPHIVDALINGDVDMVINTTAGANSIQDSRSIRRTTLNQGIPYFTRLSAAKAAVNAMRELQTTQPMVKSLQEYHSELK
ncbi:MAG: carbamoyl-phosphate synthase large subunit [Myxococcota bacterium]